MVFLIVSTSALSKSEVSDAKQPRDSEPSASYGEHTIRFTPSVVGCILCYLSIKQPKVNLNGMLLSF